MSPRGTWPGGVPARLRGPGFPADHMTGAIFRPVSWRTDGWEHFAPSNLASAEPGELHPSATLDNLTLMCVWDYS